MTKALLPILALILALGLALPLMVATADEGLPQPKIQLAVLLDGSISVNATEWDTQISGLRDAILNCVPHDGSVELTVIQFGGDLTSEGPPSYNPGAEVYISRTPITTDNAGSVADTVDTTIRNDKFGGSTPLHEGILAAMGEIGGVNAIVGARQIINISTDGGSNTPSGLPRDLAQQARDDAIEAGIDEISAEGLSNIDGSNTEWLKNRIVHPGYPGGSGNIAPPFTPGWVYPVGTDADKFTEAIGQKIPTPTPTPTPTSTASPGEEGGGCFIATAAYGSYLDSHVETLRNFRDSYMLTNPVGETLVSVYYDISPPMARFIDDHPALKPIVRVGLLPAVAMSTVAVNTTSAEKIAIVGSLALVSVALAVWLSRRRGKGVIS